MSLRTRNGYRCCQVCGHEMLASGQTQTYIVNDVLSLPEPAATDYLVASQSVLAVMVSRSSRFLVDIGAASGRFLHHNRRIYERILGIEITPECAAFARDQLGIPIEPVLPRDIPPPSVVTMWHTLEHMPADSIDAMLTILSDISDNDTSLLVAVPNARSLQYRIFGKRYAYYDVPNHLHQFTSQSLDILMNRYGFERERSFAFADYIIFGYVQSLLNLFNAVHNYQYFRMKRGFTFDLSDRELMRLDRFNVALVPVVLPIGFVLAAVDWCSRPRRAVVTESYRRKRR